MSPPARLLRTSPIYPRRRLPPPMSSTACAPPSPTAAWIRQRRHHRDQLLSALAAAERHHLLPGLVERVVADHEAHYRARSLSARGDPAGVLCAPRASSLERAFFWLSGWRPTTAVHLLYSDSGLRLEAHLPDLLRHGIRGAGWEQLSPVQLARVDELHRSTVREEDEIAGEVEELQAGAWGSWPPSDGELEARAARLGRVLERADELRARTLRRIVGILEPVQAADLLVAMADMEIGVRQLGLEWEKNPSTH